MSVLNGRQFDPVYETDHGSAKVTPTGYVYNVRVKEGERGHGYGSELMQRITSDADALGSELTLNARSELHPWYRKHGFEVATDASEFGGVPFLKRKPKVEEA